MVPETTREPTSAAEIADKGLVHVDIVFRELPLYVPKSLHRGLFRADVNRPVRHADSHRRQVHPSAHEIGEGAK